MMRAVALLVIFGSTLSAQPSEVVTAAGRWEFHSSFWMSLHQALISDAMTLAPRPLDALSTDEQAAWNAAVGAYRSAGGKGDMTFARPMVATSDSLTQTADDAVDLLTDAPMKDALVRAAPVYRKHWWTADDENNRFFIGYAAAMIRDAGPRLVREHEKVYRTPWPARVRAYITPAGGPFGAYTMVGRSGGTITTMSCRDGSYQGLRALEMLLHESSHAIVGPNNGTVATAIAAAAKKAGIPIPHDVWHAILFATSSELTRRLLAERGATEFVPYSVGMFTRAWPRFREPIEKNWIPYLNGEGTLEEAIDKVVAAIAAIPR